MPGIDFAEVRSRIRLAQVLELAAFVAVSQTGEQLRGPCPVHGSSSPRSRSFSANLGRNTFRCFRCGAAGNQLDLWVAISKLPLRLPRTFALGWEWRLRSFAAVNRARVSRTRIREEEPVTALHSDPAHASVG